MAELQMDQPKSLIRPKSWSAEVENAYRFQLAGYRDEKEYVALRKTDVKHLQNTIKLNYYFYFCCFYRFRLIDGQKLDSSRNFSAEKTATSTTTTEPANAPIRIFPNAKSMSINHIAASCFYFLSFLLLNVLLVGIFNPFLININLLFFV